MEFDTADNDDEVCIFCFALWWGLVILFGFGASEGGLYSCCCFDVSIQLYGCRNFPEPKIIRFKPCL